MMIFGTLPPPQEDAIVRRLFGQSRHEFLRTRCTRPVAEVRPVG